MQVLGSDSSKINRSYTGHEHIRTRVLVLHEHVCILQNFTLRKKCPYSELFWSALSRIQTEYEEIRSISRIQSECEKIRIRITPSTDTFHAVFKNA